jgi:flavin reductase (DIM6/NTAB) family NADH-FMN oxidoreductase RutF
VARVSAFDDLMGLLDRPMYVLTAADGDRRAGCLVGFAAQVCIDPPRFLVCVSDKNHTHAVAGVADVVAVHVLRREQVDVAETFGSLCGAEVDKFARVAWSEGPGGVPVLDDCLGWFTGRVLDRVGLGDHTGLVVEPYDARAGEGEALTFDDVRHLEPGHDA